MRWLFVLASCLPSAGCETIFPLEIDLESRCGGQGYEKLTSGTTSGFYRVETIETPWADAEAACAADGPSSHLAVLGSETEISLVFGHARSVVEQAGDLPADILIGLSKRAIGGEYKWVTSEPIPAPDPSEGPPWAPNEPMADRDCTELAFEDNGAIVAGDFISIPCEEPEPFVCECDLFPENPANF